MDGWKAAERSIQNKSHASTSNSRTKCSSREPIFPKQSQQSSLARSATIAPPRRKFDDLGMSLSKALRNLLQKKLIQTLTPEPGREKFQDLIDAKIIPKLQRMKAYIVDKIKEEVQKQLDAGFLEVIGESTTHKILRHFVDAIIDIFGTEYLRKPNSDDIAKLLQVGEARGFPGMLGSIDCMHWRWKNCPTAWKVGSHNDINVLERSHVFSEITRGEGPSVNYSINGHDYNMGYYLADGIYPPWATFVKAITLPMNRKAKYFTTAQESFRKDVERAFGVLQARFAIVRGPGQFYDRATLKKIMLACIIMHDMIVEDERELHPQPDISEYEQIPSSPPIPIVTHTYTS
ncbi:uncharacterized protein LOC124930153 [Impatiens glandulifera]|uniref:uncharacterized protein LOC124930153 n=1 Tax=Impatiens glandulifera TaxID=253017 RepID=UPI001FB12105|nr:uncharacterized protein LOC124930153 [Impatiens glandulifera]